MEMTTTASTIRLRRRFSFNYTDWLIVIYQRLHWECHSVWRGGGAAQVVYCSHLYFRPASLPFMLSFDPYSILCWMLISLVHWCTKSDASSSLQSPRTERGDIHLLNCFMCSVLHFQVFILFFRHFFSPPSGRECESCVFFYLIDHRHCSSCCSSRLSVSRFAPHRSVLVHCVSAACSWSCNR